MHWVACGLAAAGGVAALWAGQGRAAAPAQDLLAALGLLLIVSGLWGGPGPGLLATAICMLGAVGLLRHDTSAGAASPWLAWCVLLASGLIGSFFGARLQRARQAHAGQAQALATAEAQLTKVRSQLRASFDQAGVGMAMVDIDGKTLQVNHKISEITGYSVDELLNGGFQTITHPDDRPREADAFQRLLRGEVASLHREKRYVHRDGHVVWVDITSNRVDDIAGGAPCLISVVLDIQARKELEGERLLFSEAFRQATQPMLLTTPDHCIRYMNPACGDLLGYTLEELQGRHVGMLAADGAASAFTLLDRNGRFAGELTRIAKSGERIPVAASVGPIHDEQGRMLGWVGTSFDLRPLRAKDALLRKLALAVEQSPSAILITNLQFQIEYVNDSAVRQTGYDRETLMRMTSRELLSPSTPPQLRAEVAKTFREGKTWTGTLISRRKDGSDFPMATTLGPLIQPEVGMSHLVVVGDDITERQGIEAELERHRHHLEDEVAQRTRQLDAANASLRQQQHFIRTIADAVPGLVGYVDASGRYQFANAGYQVWYDIPNDALIGRSLRETMGERAYAMNEPHIRAALAGQWQQFHRTMTRHDGVPRHALLTFIPDQHGDEVRGFFSMAWDVTELKNAELQLWALNKELALRAEQAEAATRAKSAFLANMSHEIRTPMNAIIGLTHLMARETVNALQRDRLGKVDAAAKHLLQIINDVLDLSKIEAGKMTLEEDEFALDTLLSRSFELVSERAREKGLELILDTDHLPARLRGDATRLSQALVNLLANAVKFTERGWVRLRGELLREERERIQVRFEVQDTGEGISPQSQAVLFKAFEQADSSTTRRHGGTGLGLALTRHLVHLMQGEIGVTSAPGLGSTFSFTAWLTRASQAGEHAAPLQVQGLRVLVVDDLPESLSSVAERLTMMGLQVDTAPGGAEALAQVQDGMNTGNPYDLYLVDWRMAPIDGIETLRRLREMLQAGMPPAILITASDEPAMWQQARSVHCDAVLVKPITASVLHDSLMRVLRRQPATLAVLPTEPGKAEVLLRRRHAGQSVLLAEDNPINQEVAHELLRAAGLLVDTADNGERAVELACSRPYDAVLMDMQMPVMDGMAATRAIRARLGAGLPIIAMTANAFGEDRAACLESGMNDHIPKPVNPEHLYHTLLRWLPVPRAIDTHEPARLAGQAALAAERAPLHERLAAIPDIDLALALKAVNGHMPVLERVLHKFVDLYLAGVPALPHAARTNDWVGCGQMCHLLRGSCSAIGALALTTQITDLEHAVGSTPVGEGVADQAQQLHEALVSLANRIGIALA